MNIKVQFGKNIHNLPSGLSSFPELIYSIRQIIGKKLPENYTFKYQNTDNNLVRLESEEDFKTALTFLKENNIQKFKVQVVKENKPSLEKYTLPPDFSFISGSSIRNLDAVENQESKSTLISSEIREVIIEQKNDERDSQRKEKPQSNQVPAERQETAASRNSQFANEMKIPNQQQGYYYQNKTTQPVIKTQRILKIGTLYQNYSTQESNSTEKKQNNQLETDQNNQNKYPAVSNEKSTNDACLTINTKKDSQGIQPNSLDSKLPQTRGELQKMVEEIVEEKLKKILQNYQLIPKNLQLDNQEKKSTQNKVNIHEEQKESKEEIQVIPSISLAKKISVGDTFIEADQKKLRAILKTDPISEIKAESGSPYVWSFQIQNSGPQAWPSDTFFQCLQGPNENQKVKVGAVEPSKQFDIMLLLDAPFNPDKYQEVWSLVYETKERQIATFGPKVKYTLTVSPVIPKPETIVDPSKPPSLISKDQQNQIQASFKTIEIANLMKETLGGDLKQYLEFLSYPDFSNLSADLAIITYLENQKF